MKKLGIVIAFVGLSFSISAQSQYTGSLLWKVSGKDLKKPSYILGTHHTISASYVDSIQGLRQTIKQVKQVIGEIELLNTAKITGVVMQYSQMPTGYSYKSMLSEHEYNLLDRELTKHVGVGLDKLKGFHPTTLFTMLVQVICSKLFPDMQTPNYEPFDMHIQKIAHSQKKDIAGLETVEEQIEILYKSEAIETQVKNLLCLARNADEQLEGLIELTDIYYQKNLNKIYELYYAETETDEDNNCSLSLSYRNALNSNRNEKWLTILPQIMKKKSSLIVVGAGHLGGESGLLYKLDKVGYTVEAVVK